MNSQWLKAKTFGMPRWAFLALLMGGIALGLYLRARKKAEQTAQPTSVEGTDTLSGATGGEAAGLAGVGVASPPGGVYPVSQPVVPEGLGDIIATLGGALTSQTEALAGIPNAFTPQTPVVNVTVPATGGGPPTAPPKKVPSSGKCAGAISSGEYSARLAAIRGRHGAGSKEVQAFRSRWHQVGDHYCPG